MSDWRTVPLEPTPEMTRAAKWALDKARERDGLLQEPRPYTAEEKHAIRYKAMLDAAPKPPSCATCRHWGEQIDYLYLDSLKLCRRTVMFFNATEWVKEPFDEETGRRIKPEFADRLAFTNDASDYRADLLTKAEFGCVMHEVKPL